MLEIGSAPWLRLEGETSRAYDAFCHYRDLGPHRSITQAKRERGQANLNRWSSQHGWVDRAAAWDDHIRRIQDTVVEESIVVVGEQRDAAEQFGLTQLMRGFVILSKHVDVYERLLDEVLAEAERENIRPDLSSLPYNPMDVDVMKTLSEIIDKVARRQASQHDVNVLVGQIPGAALARAVLTDRVASEHALAFTERAAELRAIEPVN